MDIHKPKAAHSIREFLVEIGTITVGILIALSLEAGVEALRDQHLVEHARADLRRELTGNRKGLVRTMAEQKQAMAQLDRISQFAKDKLAGKPVSPPPDLTLVLDMTPMNTAAWEGTVATQALVHMPYEEAHDLSSAYSGSRIYDTYETEAVKALFELSTIPDDMGGLSRDELKAMQKVVALNQAYQTSLLRIGAGLMEVYDKALGAMI